MVQGNGIKNAFKKPSHRTHFIQYQRKISQRPHPLRVFRGVKKGNYVKMTFLDAPNRFEYVNVSAKLILIRVRQLGKHVPEKNSLKVWEFHL